MLTISVVSNSSVLSITRTHTITKTVSATSITGVSEIVTGEQDSDAMFVQTHTDNIRSQIEPATDGSLKNHSSNKTSSLLNEDWRSANRNRLQTS